jgi:hypothetical protein
VTTNTTTVAVEWSESVENTVQWDYRLQEILDSVRRGIEEAAVGAGRYLTDADLAPDDDE